MGRIIIIALIVISVSGFSQQIPLYNQYQFAPTIYNPGYTGFNKGINVAIFRNQKWGNYEEGFIANDLSITARLNDKHAVGINLYNDYVGITSKLRAHLLYSYHIKFNDDMGLRAGVGIGVVDNRIDFSKAIVTDANDPLFSNLGKDRRTMFDMNVGLSYYYKDFRAGFSVPQVLGSRLEYGDQNSFYTLEREMVGNVGYNWVINDEKGIALIPDALVLFTPGAPIQYGVNVVFEMRKYFWLGASYKSNYAVGFNVGVNLIDNLKVGLAYDFQIMSIASFNLKPNAEIMLKYSIPHSKGEKVDVTPFRDTISDQKIEIDSLNNLLRKNESDYKERIEGLENENQTLEDSLAKWPNESDIEDATLPGDTWDASPDDHFIELNGNDTPNGYYIITGAFAQKSNADRLLRKIKGKFPNARVIQNKRNNLYYVILFHTVEKNEGLAYASFKAKNGMEEETWILHYIRGK